MSHGEERREKNCLNCGTVVMGRYCQACGQENIVPHETFWNMVKHFFYDITHFDGKFFDSLKHLLLRPGFLSREFVSGRRAAYLNPIKMYVFTSAVFFLIFFSLFSINDPEYKEIDKSNDVAGFLQANKDQILAKTASPVDSLAALKLISLFENQKAPGKKTKKNQSKGLNFGFDNKLSNFSSLAEYDSLQSALPDAQKDNWVIRLLSRKAISLNEKYDGEETRISLLILNKFLHSFPYILFVSLPLYALFLKLLYIRNQKFYFADHGIFLIHLYIFTFILMMVFIGLGELGDLFGWNWMGLVQALLLLYGIGYTWKSMKNFYEQGRSKTFLKFILFNILCFISINILFAAFLFITFFQV